VWEVKAPGDWGRRNGKAGEESWNILNPKPQTPNPTKANKGNSERRFATSY